MTGAHGIPSIDLRTPSGVVPVPAVGFGVWQVPDEEVGAAVRTALAVATCNA